MREEEGRRIEGALRVEEEVVGLGRRIKMVDEGGGKVAKEVSEWGKERKTRKRGRKGEGKERKKGESLEEGNTEEKGKGEEKGNKKEKRKGMKRSEEKGEDEAERGDKGERN